MSIRERGDVVSESISTRLKHAWNAFSNRDPTETYVNQNLGYLSSFRPDRTRGHITNARSVINSIYNRIALDVAAVAIRHVRLDQNGKFLEVMPSGLNYCLTSEANIDQTSRALIQDIALSMFDEGVVAVVPVDTTIDPKVSGSYDIQTLRTASVVNWYPKHVRVKLYNENTGNQEEITLPKNMTAIIENPLYAVMNEPNGTLKRLIRKLALLDAIDEQSGSGKLDLIIQLPYVIKTEARREQAEIRRKAIEEQLSGSKYGIAYTDGTERVTQLNRPAENNLMGQVQYLTSMLYSQLGLTEAVFNGTADEPTMLNYYTRTIEPCLSAITDEMKRKYLTKTARTQNQSILFFRDPFKLVPVNDLAEIADKFTRNEILSSNEVRAIIGYKPADDERADALINKNISGDPSAGNVPTGSPAEDPNMDMAEEQNEIMNGLLDGLEADIDKLLGGTKNE
jgi:hypothetical protein